ncbi:GGDEF domain-containing protein [Paucibacter sp. R3-3]|uniref:diguanylate cyclase n=1 Tax=Roseateles agri TaxID=3098619 RepID=A0ABU5DKM3_9BURK|nr:GGDEF domain-containing protein [Paucibacter sp. R3-3]MDY0746855.1 GGDEF domain-containing protein [Paucibacter sp. R3-3]
MNMHPPDLPGTLARQAGMQALEQAARTAADAKKALAVLTLDVDHFKPWHDEVGEAQSAAALARLVEVLKQALPAGTPVVHLGSDEFFVMLAGHELASAQALAEQVRAAIAQGLASFDASPPLSVTVGVAASPAQGAWSGQALLALADMRMTFAKRRLVPHHNLVWAGTLPSDWYARLDIDPARWPAL